MSIRLRLILSYLAMLFIPLFSFVIAAALIAVVQIGLTLDANQEMFFGKPMHQVMKDSIRAFEELQDVAKTQPLKLEDQEYLQQMDHKLSLMNTGIIIRKQERVIYASSSVNKPEVFKNLPAFDEIGYEEFDDFDDSHSSVQVGTQQMISERVRFHFEDQTLGDLFFITDVSVISEFAKKYLFTLGITMLIILVMVNGILTFWISRSIAKPLERLKQAAYHIKEGHLDFKVECNSKDEIGQLCHAFEEMREKLKGSVELQLQYENNRKELLSNISHDLKTPMTSIKGYVEGIMDGVADTPEKTERYLKTIYTKAIDMDRLIDELFLYSKLDLKKLPFHFEKMDIVSFLTDCISELKIDLEEQKIELKFETSCSTPTLITGDREKLKRVIMNIVGNAVKYMNEEHSVITIHLKEERQHVQIQIQDNGQGIDPEDVPLIFERFYRADASRNTVKGGSGLGLAIVKRIIEAHQGTVWAQSEIDLGTSIFFMIKK